MRNVLVISSRADIAGGENYLLSCFRHLDRSQFNPVVWLPSDGKFRSELEKAGIDYFVSSHDFDYLKPAELWYEYLGSVPRAVRSIVDLIRDRNIELVHTNSNRILEGALAAKLAGIPHLYVAHIDFQPNLPLYERFPLDKNSFARLMDDLSTEIIAVSRHVRDGLCPPLDTDRVVVVNNGLEMTRYDLALKNKGNDLRSSLSLPEDALIVVAAGRITEDKGFDYLIEVASRVKDRAANVVFLVCGAVDDPSYESSLKEHVRRLGVGDTVRFLGTRSDLPELMVQCDVFALSSRREGHPYVLLEAMACNLPCVAMLCGGVKETVIDGETGFAVPVGDVGAFADRLVRLLGDPGLRKDLGQAAGYRIRAHFTARNSAAGLYDAYARTLAHPKPRAGSYSIDLLLQGLAEIGQLGERMTNIEKRLRKAERGADLILDNPLTKTVRRFVRR